MKILEELLKGEKVEWKKLGEVCTIIRGVRVTKKDLLSEGLYPVVSGGTGYMGYLNKYNRDENTITIAQYGTAGYVRWQNEKFWANDVCFSIYPKDNVENKVNKKYLYHFLLNKQEYLYSISNRSAIPYSIDSNKILRILIPLPPLSVQKKIAEVLDKFENCAIELQAELQAELQERKKQYSYYRDKLLSEDYLNGIINKLYLEENQPLRFTTLGEIGEFTRGNGLQKKDFVEKGKPVIHYGQIYTKYGFETDKTISFTSEEVFKGLRKAQRGDLIITDTSENMEDVCKVLVWNGDEEIGISGHSCMFRTNENSKYIAYLFQTNFLKKQIEKRATGTKVISISKGDMEKFNIPLPPLAIQEQVVNVLDKFREYISETNGLLPKEIEQRQKQYVYFREKLLTFDTECSKNRTEPNRTELNS